ncbi:glycosyltransferase [Peribacillus sp. SCS-155]|uniref:glycosyltransferase n=1 Tax=Peribacillus sedimenti TaxID=3115297 RepID=UPI003905B078
MKIIFVVSNLNNGGMEKALVNFVNDLSRMHDITICILGRGNQMNSQLKENINIISQPKYLDTLLKIMSTHKSDLKKNSKIHYIFKGAVRYLSKIGLEKVIYRILLFRIKKIKGFDVAVSYTGMPGIWDYFVLNKVKTNKKLAWIHNNPEVLGINTRNCFKLYNKFDAIISVSKDCKNRFEKLEPRLINKSYLIYNLININEIIEKSLEFNPFGINNKKNIVTVARIDNSQKRFDRIIECAKLLVQENILDFKWYIVGSGKDKTWLQNEIIKNKLNLFIELVGYKENPYPYLANADMLVLTSDYEGLPVTIMEALVLHVPIICTNFNCAGEAIVDKKEGIIVDKSGKAVFEAVKELLVDYTQYMNIKNNVNNYQFKNSNSISEFNNIIKKEKNEK